MADILQGFPITDPTWIFFVVLCIILFAPIVFGRLKIPHIVGMILAGNLMGPHGFGILDSDSSFELFGQVGIYYIMFLASLEMDTEGLKRTKVKSLIFGLLTFALPFASGLLSGHHLLGYSLAASALLACILASHTLVSYPIVSRYGQAGQPSVTVSIGATLVTLMISLFTLAALSGSFSQSNDDMFWVFFTLKCLLYLLGIFLIVPRIARWFFQRFEERVSQFIFVLTAVFFCAGIAKMCGLEGILGAFLAGLILNRYIPHTSPLMNRIEFVGNALFIPYFLIGVGMMINIRLLFYSVETLFVVGMMVGVGTLSKYVAADVGARIFRYGKRSKLMMFGLTEAHAAGALAMVMMGTRVEVEPGVYLMDDNMLNGVIIMILFSCIISSIATERACLRLAEEVTQEDDGAHDDERILIPVDGAEGMEQLVTLGVMIRNSKLNRPLQAVNVVYDDENSPKKKELGMKLLEQAKNIAAGSEVEMETQLRVTANVSTSVIHAMMEKEASEIIIGLHRKRHLADSFMGSFSHNLIENTHRQIMIVKCVAPINTVRRIHVAVPPKAEKETGFYRWLERLARLDEELGCRMEFHATQVTTKHIQNFLQHRHPKARPEYNLLEDWSDLLLITGEVSYDHLVVIVTARKGSISYTPLFEELPMQITKYLSNNSLMLIYPDQTEETRNITSFVNPLGMEKNAARLTEPLTGWVYNKVRTHLRDPE